MYYQLTEEQRQFKESVRRLADEGVEPRAKEIDETGKFPWDIFELFKKQGYLGLCVLEVYGDQTSDDDSESQVQFFVPTFHPDPEYPGIPIGFQPRARAL